MQEVTYYPFGEVFKNEGTVDLPYKFTGQELDSETGLYYYGARYYDPAMGRFISADSVVPSPGNPQSLNRYAYCLNNPLAYVDPTGHFSIGSFFSSLFGGIFGGAILALTGNPMLAGMASGAFSGAMSGSVKNMIMGAFMGGASGALGSVVQAGLGPMGSVAMVGIGAGSAVSKGGWESLAYMGAGMVGGAIGYNIQVPSARSTPIGIQVKGESIEYDQQQPASAPNNDQCPEVPIAPSGADIDENIRQAQEHLNPGWFYDQVRNKGPWDYKQMGREYADFGNFNYGATGTAFGFRESFLLRMAGYAQRQAGTSIPEWGFPLGSAPYGDDPADQTMIRNGIQYYRCHYE